MLGWKGSLLFFFGFDKNPCEEGSGYLLLVFSDVHDCKSRREKSPKSLGSSAASAPLDPHKISVCLVSKIRWRTCIRWWSRWVFLQLLVAIAHRTTSILLVTLGHQRSNNLQNHRILTTQILHKVEVPEMAGASSCSLAKFLCIFRDFWRWLKLVMICYNFQPSSVNAVFSELFSDFAWLCYSCLICKPYLCTSFSVVQVRIFCRMSSGHRTQIFMDKISIIFAEVTFFMS